METWRLAYKPRNSQQTLRDYFKGRVTVLAGIPGSGKSTLGEQLAAILDGVYLPEYVQSELLDLYINNQRQYAFSFQVIMAQRRIAIYSRALELASQGKAVIVDGPLICDNAFAKMLWKEKVISDKEYGVYQSMMISDVGPNGILREPDHMVYLDCTVETSLARIRKRGRPGEYEAYGKNGGKYLHDLQAAFRDVFEGATVNALDYNNDCTDEASQIPQQRLWEILGLIRDKTFEKVGLS